MTIPILLLLCACGEPPTAPETGTLTGKVTLEGQTNHSGISVALYKLAELDTTILRYNREYPLARRVFGGNVGFPISQATEFACPPTLFGRACPPGVWRNHLLREVAAETKTNKDGSFKIDREKEDIGDFVSHEKSSLV